MSIQEMRALLCLSQSKFGKKYGIPKRTIENWESGSSKCPDYVLSLLERAVKEDYKMLSEEDKAVNAIVGTQLVQTEEKELSEQDIINNRFM